MSEYIVHMRTYSDGGAQVHQSTFPHWFEHALLLIADLKAVHAEYGVTADYWMVPA
jgi:hypothetical protein